MKRFLPLLGILAILIALVIIFTGPKDKQPGNPDDATHSSTTSPIALTAVIHSLSGKVTLTPKSGTPSPAVQGQEVHAGDTIETGTDGQVTVEFFSSERTSLDVNTTVTIDAATIDPSNWKKQNVRLTLSFGRVWSRVLSLLDPTASYEVEYNGVVSVVRGTAFMLTTRSEGSISSLNIDEFEGALKIEGSATGTLREGFSAFLDTNNPPPDLATNTAFTTDDVRNDHWVRMQLQADEDFAKRNGPPGTIGREAGDFMLDSHGDGGSNFRLVEISAPENARSVTAGSRIQLTALAVFEEPAGRTTKDVSLEARWQVSDTSKATVDDGGRLTVDLNATGSISVIARWNDGTHEHSGTATFVILPRR